MTQRRPFFQPGVRRKAFFLSGIALLFLATLSFPARSLATTLEADFNDPKRCAACHEKIFEQWEGSMHSLAASDGIFRKFYEMVVDEAGPAAVEFCMKCHSPVGVFRKEVPPATGEKLDAIAMKGVFCDFCHTVTPTGIGNAAFETTFSTTKQGPFDNAVSPAHPTKTDDRYRHSEFCGMCHNVTHPISGRPIERTYYEWKESPYNTGDPATSTHCQDCHMRQYPGNPGTGATEKRDNPGKAAVMGPERPHIWTHYFIGGNALYPDSPNASRRKSLVEERLRNAARVEILPEDLPGTAGELSTFRVRVHNTGAGHKLPTGLSEVREMWLDVTVTDAKGAVLLRSGEIGEGGGIDPSAAIFKTFLGIGKSNVKLSCCFFAIGERNKILSAERVTRDRRILPKGYEEEKYALRLPPGTSYPLTVAARLNYRSMSQAFADIFYPDGSMKVPVVRMAEARLTLPRGEAGTSAR
jgi:hypothetical protein